MKPRLEATRDLGKGAEDVGINGSIGTGLSFGGDQKVWQLDRGVGGGAIL